MPARANAFYERLPKTDRVKAHVYHATTNARVAQAKFFLDQLIEEVMRPHTEESEFYKRDMFLFGLVNSLRSSLDSLAHELFLFYKGTVVSKKKGAKRDIQFINLINPGKIQISFPSPLTEHIKQFQKSHENNKGDAFRYLTKLRNVNQHRNIALIQMTSVARIGFTIVTPDTQGGGVNWLGEGPGSQRVVQAEPAIFSPVEPDLRLPDDPDVEPGDETFDRGRPLLGTLRYIYAETREFILSSYDLAV